MTTDHGKLLANLTTDYGKYQMTDFRSNYL